MSTIPEMPIFKTVDPKGRGEIGWAFYYRGTLLWSPIKAQAEGARARLRAKMESEPEELVAFFSKEERCWSPSETPAYLAFPVEESEDLPSTDEVTWISTVLDNDDLREYAAELGAAAVTACKAGELELLAQVLVDWHATAEILTDEEMMRELQEGNDEKGKSWREIKEPIGVIKVRIKLLILECIEEAIKKPAPEQKDMDKFLSSRAEQIARLFLGEERHEVAKSGLSDPLHDSELEERDEQV